MPRKYKPKERYMVIITIDEPYIPNVPNSKPIQFVEGPFCFKESAETCCDIWRRKSDTFTRYSSKIKVI